MKKKNTQKRLINGSLAIALALSIVPINMFPHSVKAATTTGTDAPVKMRFLETTDLHSNVMDYDYYKDAAVNNFGLDRTAVLIQQARAEKIDPSSSTSADYSQNSMLFDAGDLLQGNPLASYVHTNWDTFTKNDPNYVHPLFRAMKQLNYDAGIVGNHEFNYGLDYLESVLKNAPYNDGVGRDGILNANIYKTDGVTNYFTPYKIIDKVAKDENGVDQHIKVGVIGFAPPQILSWDKDNLEGKVVVKDIVATANKFIPEMRAKGADIIVAIAHSGCDVTVDNAVDAQNAENAVFALSKVPGVDALLFGHAHVNFPGGASFYQGGKTTNPDLPGFDNKKGTINGTPAMEAGFWGNNLGVMDLTLQKDANGQWKVADSQAALRPVTSVKTPDQAIVDSVAVEHKATQDLVRSEIGTTTAPMYSYFAQVQDDPTIQIVNNAQTAYAKSWIADHRPDLKDIPVLSAGAPFKAGGRSGPAYYTNIAVGPLSIKSANDLYLYDNTFKAIEIKGSTVKEWLEMSAGQFNTVNPNSTHPQDIINVDFPSYNFDVIDGVKYQVDITQKPRYDKSGVLINAGSHRIVNLTYNGQPIDDNQDFIVATNNYRAGGGGNFPGVNGKETYIMDTTTENRQILMDYIQAQGSVNPTADGNWSIAPVNNKVQLTFKSSPDAKTVADQSSTVKSIGTVTDSNGTWGNYQLGKDVHVQLLGINDFHGQLDYSTKDKATGKLLGGIQYLAGYLKEREALNPNNTLMVEAGDLIGASRPVSALLQDEPTVRFMNELGFDVGTLGNHEFDEGVTELKRMIYGGSNPKTDKYDTADKYGPYTGANFPVVAANVVEDATGNLLLPPYAIKEVDGVKIGFIGVVTTETPSIVTPSGVAGVHFTDEVEAINKYAAELKQQGIKAIVVLAHDPGTSATDGSNPTGKVVDMAKDIDPEVDVIYGAHDHKYLNSTVGTKLLVQSYSYGTAFSDVDLTIDPTTQDIVSKSAEVASTFQDDAHLDAHIKSELDAYQADIAPIVNQYVGKASVDITRTQSPAGESALGNLIADAMLDQGKTDFAFMNVGGIRDDLRKGTVTWGSLFAIQPFGNDLVTEKITGAQVRTLLNQQWSTTSYAKIMQIAGLTYTWDDKYPVGQKVVDIFLPNGDKIDPDKVYSVTVNNFMADGGDGFTILKSGTDRVTIKTDLDAFVDYVKAQTRPLYSTIEGRITVLDTTAPVATVDPITDQTKAVKGKTEAGAKIEVKVGSTVLGSTTVGTDGTFNIAIPVQKAGTVVVVTAEDAAGNVSTQNLTVSDVTTPDAPSVDRVVEGATKVTGTAEPGTHVNVNAGETLLGSAVVGDDGKFSVDIPAQAAGTELVVTVGDNAGLISGQTKVTVADITAPAAPVLDYDLTQFDTYVSGSAEAGSTVEVKVDGKVIGSAVADEDGYFVVEIPAQAVGTELVVTATDKSGNVSEPTSSTVWEQATGWVQDDQGAWYYISPVTGEPATGWLKVNNKWYFFNENAEMQTGWYLEGKTWYYLDSVNGDMKVGWAKVNGKWYYFDKYGAMQTGWVSLGGKWYFLAKSGAMQTGWLYVGGKWFYLYTDGHMAVNTTIGKYKVDKHGVWVK